MPEAASLIDQPNDRVAFRLASRRMIRITAPWPHHASLMTDHLEALVGEYKSGGRPSSSRSSQKYRMIKVESTE